LWRGRRRIRRLEDEVAAARADQAALRRRLELFEMIAGAAGAALPDQPWPETAAPSTPLPVSLAAAARTASPGETPIRLDVGGTDVIAVIGGPGDPREWWSAVCEFADRAGVAS
jgi:hypothetical protein